MAYAILRFAKRKGGAAKAIAAHNERTKEVYASNPDIDKKPHRAELSFGRAALELWAGDPTPYQHGGVPRTRTA